MDKDKIFMFEGFIFYFLGEPTVSFIRHTSFIKCFKFKIKVNFAKIITETLF